MILIFIIVSFLCLITWLNWKDIRSILSLFVNIDKRITSIENKIKSDQEEKILKS
jgi:hypothetical protein